MDRKDVRIEYVPLSKLKAFKGNPKDHDLGFIHRSMDRFGFTAPIMLKGESYQMIAGHGRIDALKQKKLRGEPPPSRINTNRDEWLVPAIRGVKFDSEKTAEAYLVADNRGVELGGWIEADLINILESLAKEDRELLEATGYDGDDLDMLTRKLEPKEPDLDILETNQKCPSCGYEW